MNTYWLTCRDGPLPAPDEVSWLSDIQPVYYRYWGGTSTLSLTHFLIWNGCGTYWYYITFYVGIFLVLFANIVIFDRCVHTYIYIYSFRIQWTWTTSELLSNELSKHFREGRKSTPACKCQHIIRSPFIVICYSLYGQMQTLSHNMYLFVYNIFILVFNHILRQCKTTIK